MYILSTILVSVQNALSSASTPYTIMSRPATKFKPCAYPYSGYLSANADKILDKQLRPSSVFRVSWSGKVLWRSPSIWRCVLSSSSCRLWMRLEYSSGWRALERCWIPLVYSILECIIEDLPLLCSSRNGHPYLRTLFSLRCWAGEAWEWKCAWTKLTGMPILQEDFINLNSLLDSLDLLSPSFLTILSVESFLNKNFIFYETKLL